MNIDTELLDDNAIILDGLDNPIGHFWIFSKVICQVMGAFSSFWETPKLISNGKDSWTSLYGFNWKPKFLKTKEAFISFVSSK